MLCLPVLPQSAEQQRPLIGLNSRYLLEALKAVDTEQVQILFNGSGAGVLIEPLEGDDFKYMIMPMRLR